MQASILGCGWLGLPLAKSIIADGFVVKGSTTTESKLAVLQEGGIYPFVIAAEADGITGDVSAFMEGSEILIIDIPPKAKSGESYPGKIKHLLPYIEKAGIKKVLFVSSTSVYGDDSNIVTEDTLPNPDTDSGKQVLESEKILQDNPNFSTTILRFAGLIGEDRHPIRHLAGRQHIANPDAPVNLIHQEDCIGLIEAIISENAWGEVFNGVAPQHPTRKDYYTTKANELGLAVPEFEQAGNSKGKTVTSVKVDAILKYTFKEGI